MIVATLLATAAPVVVPLDAACVVGTDPAAQVLRERLAERGAGVPFVIPAKAGIHGWGDGRERVENSRHNGFRPAPE